MYAENPKDGHEKSRLLSEKNKRLIKQRYVILHLLHRGAHHFEQKFIQAAGVPIFPEHGIAQVVEALYDDTVFRRGKNIFNSAFSFGTPPLCFYYICKEIVPQMCDFQLGRSWIAKVCIHIYL